MTKKEEIYIYLLLARAMEECDSDYSQNVPKFIIKSVGSNKHVTTWGCDYIYIGGAYKGVPSSEHEALEHEAEVFQLREKSFL